MTLIDFIQEYPDEESCKAKFKQYRDHAGVVCPKCSSAEHYWKRDKECYECKHCKHRQAAGTLSASDGKRHKCVKL